VSSAPWWFYRHEFGSFRIEYAALNSFDLSVLCIGGEWTWLVRQDDCDIAEGAAANAVDARQAAEAVALKLRLAQRP
jgi:hypothetical protein